MYKIINIKKPDKETTERLLEIWESAVRKTHSFLTEENINSLRPMVAQALMQAEELYCCRDQDGRIYGFIGCEGKKIEMLFIDAMARGGGLGKQLLQFAVESLQCQYVDVNEQNPQGVGFYQHMGFRTFSRSERDGQGNPFPILHMRLDGAAYV